MFCSSQVPMSLFHSSSQFRRHSWMPKRVFYDITYLTVMWLCTDEVMKLTAVQMCEVNSTEMMCELVVIYDNIVYSKCFYLLLIEQLWISVYSDHAITTYFEQINILHILAFWKLHFSTYTSHVSAYATAYFSLFERLKLENEPKSPETTDRLLNVYFKCYFFSLLFVCQ